MVVLRVIAFAAGASIVVVTALSALKTVVVPRALPSAITRGVFLACRRVFDVLAHERRAFEARDRVLAFYAPVALVVLPGVWVALVLIGFAFMFWAVGAGPMSDAFTESGSSLLTLGFIPPSGPSETVLAFIEATLGLGIIALMISYLPSIYAAFSRREQLVGQLESRAGLPPSPAELLVRYQRIGWLEAIDQDLFPKWEQWFMDVEETHTSLPALVFFRSPQPRRNWITAAGCVLDTAAIVASSIDRPKAPAAHLMIRNGYLCLRRIADYFGIVYDPDPDPRDPISVTRREFDLLWMELLAAGVPLKADRDQAWLDFSGWRVNYDTVLVTLAALVNAPPGKWSSDRGLPRVRTRLVRRPTWIKR